MKTIDFAQKLIRALENNEFLEVLEEGVSSHSVSVPQHWKGLLLTTSGTGGERQWVYHKWDTVQKVALRNNDSRPVVSFLSLTHAAGIEALFQAHLNQRKIQFIPLPWTKESLKLDFIPKVISLTPVTLWKLLSLNEGIELLSQAEEIKVGGEALSKELVQVMYEKFPKLNISTVYGTTETWSIKTRHLGNGEIQFVDELVQTELRGEELWVTTPFMAQNTITISGSIKEFPATWNTSDHLYQGPGGGYLFRPRSGKFGKNAGRKFLTGELEKSLMDRFNLSWVQLIWKPDIILGQTPHIILPVGERVSDIKAWSDSHGLSLPTIEEKESPVETQRGKKA